MIHDKLEVIAAAAHMANRALCFVQGDLSQPVWSEAPYWQKTSSMKGVEGALNGNTPRQSHESWLKEKVLTGWKYGPVKDPEKKTHPCMVEYDKLAPAQQVKDEMYLDTVREIAKLLKPSNEDVVVIRTCNRHSNCDKADADAGYPRVHCNDDECDDFGCGGNS